MRSHKPNIEFDMHNGNGDGNGQIKQWTLGARTFSDYREFLEAQDLRKREVLMAGAGVGPEKLGPPLVVPEGATPENFDPEPRWPISNAIDEALKKRYRLFTAAQLNSTPETRYLIPGILAAGQPGGIYGGLKTLKTSLAADLLISLASGTPFLGRFPVPQPSRVLFLSGEAGLDALKSTARRICRERGLSLESLDNLMISPDLPRLDRPVDLIALRELIEIQKPVCLVIDPISLAMGESNCRNPFTVSAHLRELVQLCETTGCAILVVHHAKRSHKAGSPPTLDDIAWSGIAEFSAQWLLVSRRRPYNPDTGHHELWLAAGGRSGHHGLWALDVDEGAPPPLPDDGPILPADENRRTWKTALRSVAWAEAQADEQFVASSEDRRLRRRALAVERQGERVLELLAAYPNGCTARFLREELGLSGDRISRVLDRLVEKGVVVTTEERYDRRRMIVTYSRVPMMDLSDAAVKAGRITPPDQKVYDPRTGFFSAVGVARAGTIRPAAGGIWNESATGRDALAGVRPLHPGAVGVGGDGALHAAAGGIWNESAMGRDALFNRENTGNLIPTHARREAASSIPSNPAAAAPGPGAMPLAGRDALFNGENTGNLIPTNARREAASSIPSNPAAAAPGPGAMPLADLVNAT